jgi:hypothetical protein
MARLTCLPPVLRGHQGLVRGPLTFRAPRIGYRRRLLLIQAGYQANPIHLHFTWAWLYRTSITDGSADVLKEVNSRLRTDHAMGSEM